MKVACAECLALYVCFNAGRCLDQVTLAVLATPLLLHMHVNVLIAPKHDTDTHVQKHKHLARLNIGLVASL